MVATSSKLFKIVLCVGLAFLGCSSTIITALSRNAEGSYDYLPSSVPFLAESTKLLIASWLLLVDTEDAETSIVVAFSSIWRYLTLAVMYAFQNNLLFYALKHVNAATYQVAINLKIPCVAVLLYMFTNKRFTRPQIFALALLVAGSMIVQLDSTKAKKASGETDFLGFLFLAIIVALASTATVFNELLLKDKTCGSMHWQNVQLYTFGTIFTFCKFYMDLSASTTTVFGGYNLFTWLTIANLAFFGIMTSAVLKVCDNIMRSYASVGSVFLAALMTWMFLNASLSLPFFVGATATCISILIYTGAWTIKVPGQVPTGSIAGR